MLSRVTIFLCLLALAAPTAASAQDAFSQLTQGGQTQQQAPAQSTNTDSGGLKNWQEVLIFVGGGILLFGIGYAIIGDARRNAPVEESTDQLVAAKAQREMDLRRRKERQRAAAKRARASRKRNR